MICQNPECKREFTPERDGQLYCRVPCRNRAMKLREKARRNATDKSSITHPCRRCGQPAGYKKMYCDNCKGGQAKPGAGVQPLNTSRIRAARAHELEMIERVVAKAQAGGGPENMYRTIIRTSYHGVKVG